MGWLRFQPHLNQLAKRVREGKRGTPWCLPVGVLMGLHTPEQEPSLSVEENGQFFKKENATMMKKLVALLMALALLCTSIGAFATEEDETKHVCEGNIKSASGHYACEDDLVETVPATCTENEYSVYRCQAPGCGQTFKVEKENSALNHDLDYTKAEITIKPTCTSKGERHVPCNRPGCEGVTEEVEMAEHDWVAGEPVKVTCKTDGYTPNVCSVCNATAKFDVVPATGHHLKVNPDVEYDGEEKPDSYKVMDENLAKLTKDNLPAWYIWTLKEDQTCGQDGSLLEFAVCEDCGTKVVFTESSDDMTKLTNHQEVLDNYVERKEDETDDAAYADRIIKKALGDAEEDEDGKLYIEGYVYDNGTEYPGKYGDVEVIYTPATCLEDGSLILKCTTCDAEVKIVEPAKGHFYEINKKGTATDCTVDSWYMITCTRDGCDFQEQVMVEARGYHKPDEDGTVKYTQKKFIAEKSLDKEVPTEDKPLVKCLPYIEHIPCEGYTEVVELSNGQKVEIKVECTKTIDNEHKATEGHKAGDGCIDIKATCQKEGLKYFYCEDCGYSDGGIIEKKAHDQDIAVVVTAPGCETEGKTEYYCSMCNTLQATKTIPATGHDYRVVESATKQPTCTEPGYKYEICSYCNDKKSTEIPPQHDAPTYQEIIEASKTDSRWAFKAADCTNPGSKTYMCKACHHFVTEPIKALGHDWQREGYETNIVYEKVCYDKHVNATCERNEYYGHYCESCKKNGQYVAFEEVEVENTKLDHKIAKLYLDTNKLPTCTSTGRGVYKCANCGYYDTEFVLPALPHNVKVDWDSKAGTYKITCEKATWADDWDTLMKDYLKDEFANQGLTEAEAESYRSAVLADLKAKLMQKDATYIPGIDCDMDEVVEIGKAHYSIDLDLDEGSVVITPDENCVTLENPRLTVLWCYISDSGESFSHCYSVSQDKDGTFDVGIVEAPYGYKLAGVCIYVTDVKTNKVTVAGPNNYGIYSDTF